ncbi:MAG TPA: SDR family oxidoreductase [Acidimicrobiales bacterium]|jgi:NAD(P)-dependent dehydrogenase (short-subunit alcohol dehydrogenase family)
MQALVIGGGSGIGAELAGLHRAQGTTTIVWDVAGERDATCDITDPAAIEQAVAGLTTVPELITITAGVGHAGLLTEADPAEWDRIMAVNARGPWLCMRALASALQAAGQRGSIVATSSISARLADRGMGLYCASKAALSMVVKVAAAEWGPWGIRVNAIAPGVTVTPMLGGTEDAPWLRGPAERTALGRLGQASDIAEAIVALHQMSWVTGQVLECDGGLSLQSPIDPLGEMEKLRRDRSR